MKTNNKRRYYNDAYKNDFLKKTTHQQNEIVKIILDNRKFEIDLYWRRSAYFLSFISITFGLFSYLNIQKSTTYLNIALISLGLLFSVAWFFVNKGGKFWHENWENHIDLIEDTTLGPLFKVNIGRPEATNINEKISMAFYGPSKYSVGKINILLSLFFVIIWFTILAIQIISDFIYNINYQLFSFYAFSYTKFGKIILFVAAIMIIIALLTRVIACRCGNKDNMLKYFYIFFELSFIIIIYCIVSILNLMVFDKIFTILYLISFISFIFMFFIIFHGKSDDADYKGLLATKRVTTLSEK